MKFLTKDGFFMKEFVTINRNLFEDCAKRYNYPDRHNYTKYTQLNYKMILKDMVDFVNGYIEYKEKDTKKYSGKVLSTAKTFYDEMFKNSKKYRKNMYLPEIKDSYEDFLIGTKALQRVLEDNAERANKDPEFHMLLTMTDNQYRKLAKVCRCDMQIYLWLATEDTISPYNIPAKLRADFIDSNTPVIHPKKIKSDDVEKYGDIGPDDDD